MACRLHDVRGRDDRGIRVAGRARNGFQRGREDTDVRLARDPDRHRGVSARPDWCHGVPLPRRVLGAVDVRGGGPGTVNTDYLRIGYTTPELDAVVFSGGSWYGLENTTAVATALKDDGVRDGTWVDLALSVGRSSTTSAIAVSTRSTRTSASRRRRIAPRGPACFRWARRCRPIRESGRAVRLQAHSGQGGAFRKSAPSRSRHSSVVNALGVVTVARRTGRRLLRRQGLADRDSEPRICSPAIPEPQAGLDSASSAEPGRRNTTISLVVTNQKLEPWELQRLAVRSTPRWHAALQPFATEFDGDVLYAVSTAEFDGAADSARLPLVDLGVVASETMWDAILSSVPVQPTAAKPSAGATQSRSQWQSLTGDYEFSPFVTVRVTAGDDGVYAQAVGARKAYAIERDAPVKLVPAEGGDYLVPGRYPLTLRFSAAQRLVINPGDWQQIGTRK